MNRDRLKEIYTQYGLEKDDIFVLKFKGKEKPIITRSGVERIQKQLSIDVNYKVEKISEDQKSCVIHAHGVILENVGKEGEPPKKIPSKMCQSFGEVSPANNTNPFPIAICEKRALARVVLKMANLIGFYSEDESEDFKK